MEGIFHLSSGRVWVQEAATTTTAESRFFLLWPLPLVDQWKNNTGSSDFLIFCLHFKQTVKKLVQNLLRGCMQDKFIFLSFFAHKWVSHPPVNMTIKCHFVMLHCGVKQLPMCFWLHVMIGPNTCTNLRPFKLNHTFKLKLKHKLIVVSYLFRLFPSEIIVIQTPQSLIISKFNKKPRECASVIQDSFCHSSKFKTSQVSLPGSRARVKLMI